MFDLTGLPKRISTRIDGLAWSCDTVGMSNSTILLYDDIVLKIEKVSRSSTNEQTLLEWLEGKLPVPRIIEHEFQDGYSFLLMSRMSGEMAFSNKSMHCFEKTVRTLANGLQMLWQIDISNCPCSNAVSEKLVQAQERIKNNLVDVKDFEPETFGVEGFESVAHLYSYLEENPPKEDLVFSHGDFCLPNVFVSGCEITGFIDWGNGGVADRWQDIALCVRSLRHNCTESGLYGEAECQRYERLLFSEIGVEPCEEKIRYYILLDELF